MGRLYFTTMEDDVKNIQHALMRRYKVAPDTALEATHEGFIDIQDVRMKARDRNALWYVCSKNRLLERFRSERVRQSEEFTDNNVPVDYQPEVEEEHMNVFERLEKKLTSEEYFLLNLMKKGAPHHALCEVAEISPLYISVKKKRLMNRCREILGLLIVMLITLPVMAQDISITQGADTLLTIPVHEDPLYNNISVGVDVPINSEGIQIWTVSGQTNADSVAVLYDCSSSARWKRVQSSNKHVIYQNHLTKCSEDATIRIRFYHDSDTTEHVQHFPVWTLFP